MFKNRFLFVLSVFSVLLLAAAVSVSFTMNPTAEESGWPPKAIPVTGEEALSDYYQRHFERNRSAANSVGPSDHLTRHPELRGGMTTSVGVASQGSAIDECFDVSISELVRCREASQSASQ